MGASALLCTEVQAHVRLLFRIWPRGSLHPLERGINYTFILLADYDRTDSVVYFDGIARAQGAGHESCGGKPGPQSTGEMIMRQNGNGFSALAKGLVIGSVLGAAAAFLYAPRGRAGFRSDISEEGEPSQLRGRPPFGTRIEESYERGKHLRPSIGWLVFSILASVVARISDSRSKKRG